MPNSYTQFTTISHIEECYIRKLYASDGKAGTAGEYLGSTSEGKPIWITPPTPIILRASLTNSKSNIAASTAETVKFDNVETQTNNESYDVTDGVFTAPRDAHYMVNVFARVADSSNNAPYSRHVRSFIQYRHASDDEFENYSITDTIDAEGNLKTGTGSSHMIIKLLAGEQIRHQVGMYGGGEWAIRGDDSKIRGTYLSIHNID